MHGLDFTVSRELAMLLQVAVVILILQWGSGQEELMWCGAELLVRQRSNSGTGVDVVWGGRNDTLGSSAGVGRGRRDIYLWMPAAARLAGGLGLADQNQP